MRMMRPAMKPLTDKMSCSGFPADPFFGSSSIILPSALCGSPFWPEKTDDEEIILFRQFAFGEA